MQRRIPDTSKLRAAIGWEPERSLEEIMLDVRDHQLEAGRLALRAA